MVELLWAFGSVLFVMLIVYFLPLGFTKKGKVILVFTSFLLALGGLAATDSFSFLQTVLMLFVLILFVTYLMDQRLGKWLYVIDDDSLAKQEDEDFFMNSEMETAVSRDNVYQSKGEQQLEPINLLKVNDEKKPQNEFKKERESDFLTVETEDEDISFLLNRSILMEKEQSEIIEEPMHEVDYLSEIEELLIEDIDESESVEQSKLSQNQAIIVDDEHEIPVISFDDKPLKNSNETSTNAAQQFDGLDEIPIIPFHEKEGKQP
jgi:hypothetical protein